MCVERERNRGRHLLHTSLKYLCLKIARTLQAADGLRSLGISVLDLVGVFPHKYWYWIGVAALVGFTILFNVLFTVALMYLNRKSALLLSHTELFTSASHFQ